MGHPTGALVDGSGTEGQLREGNAIHWDSEAEIDSLPFGGRWRSAHHGQTQKSRSNICHDTREGDGIGGRTPFEEECLYGQTAP